MTAETSRDGAMDEALRASAGLSAAITARRGADSRLTVLFDQLTAIVTRLKARAEAAESSAAEWRERSERAEARTSLLESDLATLAAERASLLRSVSVMTAAMDDASAALRASDDDLATASETAERILALDVSLVAPAADHSACAGVNPCPVAEEKRFADDLDARRSASQYLVTRENLDAAFSAESAAVAAFVRSEVERTPCRTDAIPYEAPPWEQPRSVADN